jgi:signal transduction histidine kinase
MLGFNRWKIYVLTSLLAFVFAHARAEQAKTAQSVVQIDQATLTELSVSEAPRTIKLPLLEARSPRVFQQFRLTADFALSNAQAQQPLTVYCIALHDGGRVSINGAAIGEVRTASAQTTVRNIRPYIFNIPPLLLKEGVNKITLEWSGRESLTISRMFIGPQAEVLANYQDRLFWQNTMAQIAFTYALIISLILLGIFSIRRSQSSYLLLGLSALGCALSVFVYILPAMPAGLYPYWRSVHMLGIALFTNGAWLFLMKECRPQNHLYPRLCIAWAAFGPIVLLINFWLNDVSFMRIPEGVWAITTIVAGVYPISLLIVSIYRRWAWRNFVFLLTTCMAVLLGVGDILFQSTGGSVFGKYGYSIQVISPIWLTSLAAVLITDFVKSLTAGDAQVKKLAESLAAQQVQLTQLHEANQVREKERAVLEERQRIMADIHDGLGSQLISSLALSERGALSHDQTSLILRECIDDLRLAIDTLSEAENQFEIAAGNLRFRLEPRLRAAGIKLVWETNDLPENLTMPEEITLPLLRILQESVTNALRHSGATQIKVTLGASKAAQPNQFTMQISDNGRGFNEVQTSLGKGISGMHKRARSIQAKLSIESSGGTTVSLVRAFDK